MDALTERLDRKFREWSPETAEQVRSRIAEIIERADEGLLDVARTHAAGQGASDLAGIERTPAVCGGDPCIARTRIPVWVLEQGRRLGLSEADLLRSYPTLRAEDLVHAWSYVRAHADEIERQIRAHEDA